MKRSVAALEKLNLKVEGLKGSRCKAFNERKAKGERKALISTKTQMKAEGNAIDLDKFSTNN